MEQLWLFLIIIIHNMVDLVFVLYFSLFVYFYISNNADITAKPLDGLVFSHSYVSASVSVTLSPILTISLCFSDLAFLNNFFLLFYFKLFHSVVHAALKSLPKPQSSNIFLVSLQTWRHALDVLGEWTIPP